MTRRCGARLFVFAVVGVTACGGDASSDSAVASRDEGAATQAQSPAGKAGPTIAGEIVEVEPVAHQIFDEVVEPDGPRRVTLHMLVSTEGDRSQLRATLSEVIMSAVERDQAAVAIRAIGYRPRQVGPDDAEMEPFVWAEWLPEQGWYDADARSGEGLHRLYFYHPVAPQW